MPAILVIDIPRDLARASLPLDRYYPMILETEEEAREMEAFLAMPRPQIVLPDLFDRKPSALRCEDIVFARHAPAAPGWPWLLLCCWPRRFTDMVPANSDLFAGSAYTIELFETLAELVAAEGGGWPIWDRMRRCELRHQMDRPDGPDPRLSYIAEGPFEPVR